MILAVCLSGAEAFRITVVHTLSEQIGAVLIRLVKGAATIVAIVGRGLEERIGIVVVVPCALLLTQARQILLLKPVLRHALLLLQLYAILLYKALLLFQMLTVLRHTLLLLTNKLLLLLL